MRVHGVGPFILAVAVAAGTGSFPAFGQAAALSPAGTTLRPDASRWIAYFSGHGGAYQGQQLYLLDRVTGHPLFIGRADPFERPILSADQERLLYVRVRAVRAFPGARWSLIMYNRRTHRSRVVASANAMNLSPLGWQNGAPLYTLATETQTGLYRMSGRRSAYISFLFTEPLAQPSLAPGGGSIAYVTPADCTWCTLAIFDLATLTSWFGPTGVPGKYTIAWTAAGDTLVTITSGHLVAIDVESHQMRRYTFPRGLPRTWTHPMRASFRGTVLKLVDSISGRGYLASISGS